MNNISVVLRQFNWRVLLVRLLVNAVTLLLVVLITPRIYFVNPSVASLIFLAVALGILNGLIKPIIHFFTLPFIFASYGLVVILVNTGILLLLSGFFPELMLVDSIIWALVAGALYGVISAFLETLCGLDAPIIADEPEKEALRERVEAQAAGMVRTLIDTQEEDKQLVGSPAVATPGMVIEKTTVVAAEGSGAANADDAAKPGNGEGS